MDINKEIQTIFNSDQTQLLLYKQQLDILSVVCNEAAKRAIAIGVVQAQTTKPKQAGRPKQMTRIDYTDEQKRTVRFCLIDNETPASIAAKADVPVKYVYNVKRHMKKRGEL